MTVSQALQLMYLHQKEARLIAEPDCVRRRPGESREVQSARLTAMYEERQRRAREAVEVAEAERWERGQPAGGAAGAAARGGGGGGRPPPAEGGGAYFTLSTCSNSSSTGVARPKMETLTFTRPRSKSSSSTVPLKLAKGPSRTLTESPIS